MVRNSGGGYFSSPVDDDYDDAGFEMAIQIAPPSSNEEMCRLNGALEQMLSDLVDERVKVEEQAQTIEKAKAQIDNQKREIDVLQSELEAQVDRTKAMKSTFQREHMEFAQQKQVLVNVLNAKIQALETDLFQCDNNAKTTTRKHIRKHMSKGKQLKGKGIGLSSSEESPAVATSGPHGSSAQEIDVGMASFDRDAETQLLPEPHASFVEQLKFLLDFYKSNCEKTSRQVRELKDEVKRLQQS